MISPDGRMAVKSSRRDDQERWTSFQEEGQFIQQNVPTQQGPTLAKNTLGVSMKMILFYTGHVILIFWSPGYDERR